MRGVLKLWRPESNQYCGIPLEIFNLRGKQSVEAAQLSAGRETQREASVANCAPYCTVWRSCCCTVHCSAVQRGHHPVQFLPQILSLCAGDVYGTAEYSKMPLSRTSSEAGTEPLSLLCSAVIQVAGVACQHNMDADSLGAIHNFCSSSQRFPTSLP